MNKYIVLSFSALVIFFTSCATTKRTYPAAFYQCEKCGETFEISKSIDEQNLSCPDKTCGGKLVKVASYKRYGSGQTLDIAIVILGELDTLDHM